MRICFLLPGYRQKPVGGFKVVYEYANRLVERGHYVTVIHPAASIQHAPVIYRIKKGVRFIQRKMDQGYKPGAWFNVRDRVHLLWVPSPREKYIPNADIIVATAWETAEWVAAYPDEKGLKYYLIQHQETWAGEEARVMATWKLPLHKIVIARWLADIAGELGESAEYVPNGLDFNAVGVDRPPEERDPATVVMLYHLSEWKGSKDGLQALKRVKKLIPDLQANLFGVPECPADLPDWVHYHRNPTPKKLRELYNGSAILIAPSRVEGWGLVPSEGLSCGCALAATDVGGHREFSFHDQTALVSPPCDPVALAKNIERLIGDRALRLRLARGGHEFIQQFTWEKAVAGIEDVFFKHSITTSSSRG